MLRVDMSQLQPISTLPRRYNDYVKQAEKEGAVIFMRRSLPAAVLVNFDLWQKLERLRRREEEVEALAAIRQSESEYQSGQVIKCDTLKEALENE